MATATKAPPKARPVVNDREIREDHAEWLRQALGLQEHESPPAKVVESYWELKRIADRLGMGLTPREIILSIWLLGHGKPTAKEEAPPTVVELYRKKQIKLEDTVEVLYRDVWMDGVLKNVTGNNELIVQPVGESDERRFTVEQVRIPAADTGA